MTRIEYHSEMYDSETSRDWVTLHSDKDDLTVPVNFINQWDDLIFNPGYRGLVGFKPFSRVPELINDIDNFDRKHNRELAEYRRLKAKFEGV